MSPVVPAEELKSEIERVLTREVGSVSRRIIVEVATDRVKLWGCVTAWAERDAVEQAAWSVPGVHEVSNHITVEDALAATAAT